MANWLRRLETTAVHQIGNFRLGFHVGPGSEWFFLGTKMNFPLSEEGVLHGLERQKDWCAFPIDLHRPESLNNIKVCNQTPAPIPNKHKTQHLFKTGLARSETQSRTLSWCARVEWPQGTPRWLRWGQIFSYINISYSSITCSSSVILSLSMKTCLCICA